jgi:hypothetical protein
MRAIVTLQNADGTYDEVGMNNRTLIGHFSREGTVFRRAFTYARGKPHRVELFMGDRLDVPAKTKYVRGTVC